MNLLFAHGWGYTPDFWTPLLNALPSEKVTQIDLGYFGPSQLEIPDDLSDTICIGHSLGAAWLVANLPHTPKAFIAINCFQHFPSELSDKMKPMFAGLNTNSTLQLRAFYRLCGDKKKIPAESCNINQLENGLKQLEKIDVSNYYQKLLSPLLILNAQKDRIFPHSFQQEQWQSYNNVTHPTSGHALPIIDPDWCAEKILSWHEKWLKS